MRFRDVDQAAAAVLSACRNGEPWPPEAFDALLAADSPAHLFTRVVEPLCDAFEPEYCGRYADLFSQIIERAVPGCDAPSLRARYESIRQPRPFAGPEPADVCVLSRVTLGADIALTSVVLDAVKLRFPASRIHFVGPAKNFELFNADARLSLLEAPYGRSARLTERLRSGLALRDLIPAGALVVDPDSRLTQLGLLPVTPDPRRHVFFESRSAGGAASQASLTALTAGWCAEVFGVTGAGSYLATSAPAPRREPGLIAVSLGVGDNPAKRFADPFETELMKALVETGRPILADLGAGGDEAQRVRQAAAGAGGPPGQISLWNGSFASFAASVAASALYVGYDSSGQHAAAASGVARLTMFAGFPNDRFLARWQPTGAGASRRIVASSSQPSGNRPAITAAARQAIAELLG